MTYRIRISCDGTEPLKYLWEAFDESGDQRDYYRDTISTGIEDTESDAEMAASNALRRHYAFRKRIVNKTYDWKP